MSSRDKKAEVPTIIFDQKTDTKYIRGQFLGKGGFARCFEFTNSKTNTIWAGKVVPKSILVKPQHKSKITEEISIHRSLDHPYIVKFESYFQDDLNIYIMLELCSKRSMMELHKRRRAVTVPEVRYFMHQITLACKYLHDNNIIHRDLKLGNLFLNNNMEIKVGDFGLATRLSHAGERKKTLCGTPNYIAPEIIKKQGHSFEVDIWSLGCIMYTLLIGVPPFETTTLRDTYMKIKKNEYTLPKNLDEDAKLLIREMLNAEPTARPKPDQILTHRFLTREPILRRIPTSCLTMEPRINAMSQSCFMELDSNDGRKPLMETNQRRKIMTKGTVEKPKNVQKENMVMQKENMAGMKDNPPSKLPPSSGFLSELLSQLSSVNSCEPGKLYTGNNEEAQDPASVPFVWISKWVDYTDKYGLGYQLCDNSVGIVFNDSTLMIRFPNTQTLAYTSRQGQEYLYSMDDFPVDLKKKIELLKYFTAYMNNNLLKAGEDTAPKEGDEMAKVPYLCDWIRFESSMVFLLSNGTLQINFFDDHTKVIICPIMGAVSFIDEDKKFTVYKLKLIEQYGCAMKLASRLQYAESAANKLLVRYQHKQLAQKESYA